MSDILAAGDKIAAVVAAVVSLITLIFASRDFRRAAVSRERAQVALSSAIDLAEASEEIDPAAAGRRQESLDESVPDRIDRVARSLRESELLIAELQAEMTAGQAAVERLRAQEEESRRLAALSEDEARAVKDLIGRVIDSAHEGIRARLEHERAELRDQLAEVQTALQVVQATGRRDQIRFFLYGVLASIPIGILVNIFF